MKSQSKTILKFVLVSLFILLNLSSTFIDYSTTVFENSEEYADEELAIQNKKFQRRINCLAMNIYHEARGEGKEGMKAVAAVTMNRLKHKNFPGDVCEVVYQYKQFEWTEKTNLSVIDKKSKEWNYSLKLAYDAVINDEYADNTNGSLWFHSIKILPYWANSDKIIMSRVINNHVFYTTNKGSK